ncbi:hypothetical protein PHYPSEUDO_014085 [Phytophthora pseudosyringae]|uniref:Uncharacterized protein n=1 Tax=Phytophthora pseudosyringae TaxID=221518 RepID=A0A8T1V9F4_9STRA|nr:hypothetical protein PHYPSEUDO_014085 [Phytophthora pseudosyringae]
MAGSDAAKKACPAHAMVDSSREDKATQVQGSVHRQDQPLPASNGDRQSRTTRARATDPQLGPALDGFHRPVEVYATGGKRCRNVGCRSSGLLKKVRPRKELSRLRRIGLC